MIAGALEVQLYADVARFAADMENARRTAEGALTRINDAVETTRKALEALGVGLTLGGLVAFVKGAVDAAAALDHLSERMAISVEQLSQLQFAGKLVDVSTESMTMGIKKLSVSIADAAAGQQKSLDLFKALGISVNDASGHLKSTHDVLLEMSNSFQRANDSAGKTAVAIGLMGRAGDEMIPLLNRGSAAIEEMEGKADRLGLTVSKEFAAQADEFNTNLTIIESSSHKLAIQLGGELVSALGDAMAAFAKTTEKSGKMAGFKAFLDQAANDLLGWEQHQFEKQRANLQADIDRLTATLNAPVIDMFNRMDEVRRQLEQKRAQLSGLVQDYFKFSDAAGGGRGFVNPALVQPNKTDIKAPAQGGTDPYDTLIRSIKEKDAALQVDMNMVDKATDAEKMYAKYIADVANGYIPYNAAKERALANALGELDADERLQRAKKDAYDLLVVSAKAQDEYNKSVTASLLKLQEEADVTNLTDVAKQRLTAEHEIEKAALANLFKTRVDANGELVKELAVTPEVAAAILLRMNADKKSADVLVEKVAAQKLSVQYDQEIAQGQIDARIYLDDQQRQVDLLNQEAQKRWAVIASMKEDSVERQHLIEQYQQWYQVMEEKIAADKLRSIWQTVDSTAQQAFEDIFNGGKNAFTNLAHTLKTTLIDLLYQMTVRKWVFDITAQITGSSLGQSALSLAGGGNNLSSMLGLGNLFGSGGGAGGSGGFSLAASDAAFNRAIGGSPLTSLFGGNASLASAGQLFGIAAGGAMVANLLGSALGLKGAQVTTATVGGALLGGIPGALLGALVKPGGGPKTESGSGALDVGRGDSTQATAIMAAIQAQYAGIAGLYDVADTTLSKLGVFLSLDPQGTAQNQLQVQAGSYQRSALYGGNIENAGRGANDLNNAALIAEDQAVLKNLQDSIKGPMGDYLKSVDITTASLETMNRALQVAQDVGTFDKAVSALGPTFSNLTSLTFDQKDAIVKAAGGVQGFGAEISAFYNDFATDAEKHDALMQSLTQTYAAANVELPTSEAGFKAAVNAALAAGNATAVQTLLSTEQAFKQLYPAIGAVGQAASQFDSVMQPVADDIKNAAAAMAASRQGLIDFQNEQRVGYANGLMKQQQEIHDLTNQALNLIDPAAGVLAQRRDVLASLGSDEARKLQERIWAEQDLADASKNMQTRMDALATSTQATIDRLYETASALQSFRDQLTTSSQGGLSGRDQYEATKRALATSNAQNIDENVRRFLDAAKTTDASSLTYARDRAYAQHMVDQIVSDADAQAMAAQASANAAALALRQDPAYLAALNNPALNNMTPQLAYQLWWAHFGTTVNPDGTTIQNYDPSPYNGPLTPGVQGGQADSYGTGMPWYTQQASATSASTSEEIAQLRADLRSGLAAVAGHTAEVARHTKRAVDRGVPALPDPTTP